MAKPKQPSKSSEKKSAVKQQPSMPMIDPAQATHAAAAMIAQGLRPPAPTGGKESAAFRNLKEGLNKPHGQTMSNLLEKSATAGQKKSALPFSTNKQLGHNQTFGADVNRHSVPRRTGG